VRVCVQGLWHQGAVTAASLAAWGHQVVGLDPDAALIEGLRAGRPAVSEPGLADAVARQGAAGRLSFEVRPEAAAGAELVWIAFDTPVDDDDRADVAFVEAEAARLAPHLAAGAVVVVSAQLPVGSVARLARRLRAARPGLDLSFACVPENLRLGSALEVFQSPDRVVAGVEDGRARQRIAALLAPVAERIEWMGIESAEVVKHAVNAFLALSVTFANELAQVCERVGADAKDVERGLKTERRIGPRAYLGPGGAFAGGTLARDVAFLGALGAEHGLTLPVLSAVKPSNDHHRGWVARALEARLPAGPGAVVALWGLTYKPGTDTLRRSSAIELARRLLDGGRAVQAFDPAVQAGAAGLDPRLRLASSPEQAARGADALVIGTEWPALRAASLPAALAGMRRRLVLDPSRFLAAQAAGLELEYVAVGTPAAGRRP